MRKVGKHKNLKPLVGCRGYYHDGSQVYDRLGRKVPMDGGKVRVLVNFQWKEIDLGGSKPKRKTAAVKKSED